MAYRDFSKVDDSENYASIPAGTYVCKVAEVRPGRARDGSERWSFRLVVSEGEYAGRTAAWDSLTWSDRGVMRIKTVLAMFGFNTEGELELEHTDLEEVSVRADLYVEDWEDPRTGKTVTRMCVPYNGYSRLDLLPAGAPAEAQMEAQAVGEHQAVGIDRAAPTRDPGAHDRGTFDDSPF